MTVTRKYMLKKMRGDFQEVLDLNLTQEGFQTILGFFFSFFFYSVIWIYFLFIFFTAVLNRQFASLASQLACIY